MALSKHLGRSHTEADEFIVTLGNNNNNNNTNNNNNNNNINNNNV